MVEIRGQLAEKNIALKPKIKCTVLVKSFAHLNGIFSLASLEEIGTFYKWWTVYSGVLQLTDFLGMIICDSFLVTLVAVEACLRIKIALGKCIKSV